MKVTVIFGDMRIIVPCGDGDLLISELMERATNRYKKASEKGEHCVVQVKYLETVKERARLDVDDQVMDVCDDKDMLTAIYNENNKHVKIDNVVHVKDEDSDSGVAADAFGLLSNPDSTYASLDSSSKPPRGPTHRQHAKTKNSSFRSSASSNSPSSSPEIAAKHLLNVKSGSAFGPDGIRKSLSSNHPILYKWQEKSSFGTNDHSQEETDSDKSIEGEEIRFDQDSMTSIDIKPYTNAEGVEIGLIVQSIVEGGNVNYIGELQVADRITEVNGVSLLDLSNEKALSVFNNALKCGEVTAKRTRSHSFVKESLRTSLKSIEIPTVQKPADVVPVVTPKQVLKQTVEEVKDAKESAVEAPIVHKEEAESNMFIVDLIKGSNGLGFTVTSKDVVTSKTTRIFIKNILRGGAAIEDGRIQAGDELLMVNNIAVGGKTQGEVVKLLRQSEGTVLLKLSRLKGNLPPPIDKSQFNADTPETPETFPPSKRPTLSPLLKAAVISHIKPVVSISPLAKQAAESSITTSQQQQTYIPELVISHEIKDKGKRLVLEEASLCKGCINLTIPLAIQDNVGLGISVKGKIMKETGEEKGIFVKSIVPGTNAEKDGRVLVGDQLLAINSVSLKGMSNSAAMTLLKNTLAESAKDGVIRINVNRSIQSTDSTDNDSNQSQGSYRSVAGLNIKMDSKTDAGNEKKGSPLSNHGISRTTSYFKAVNRPTSPKPIEKTSKSLFFQPDQSIQKDRDKVINEQTIENGKLWGVNIKEKDLPLPTYEQALQHKETQSQSGTPPKSSARSMAQYEVENAKEKNTKSSSLEMDTQTSETGQLKAERGISYVSQSSLDSVLTDSQKVTFTRDGPGRLSMSEKKGRGQIDATKSRFYNNLKKFKSMEELRAPEGENFHLSNHNDMDMRRTSSIDTITSRLDENEKNACLFNRGTVYSSSTPYFGSDEHAHTLGRTSSSPISPSSPTKKKDSPDEKKKKGFLNSIGIFLKRAKKRKEDELGQGHSPEYITNPEKFPFDRKALLEVYEDVENNNKNISDNLTPGISEHSKYLQADRLQMKLVEEKINEMHMRDRKDKLKKLDTVQKCNLPKNEGKIGSDEKPYIPLTGYHTWQAHDPKNMREKSKQFFTRDSSSNQSYSSNSLQRQHSLPPKNSAEVHRVLPRAPSGPMYKSPDRSKLKCEYTTPPNNNRQHEPRNISRKIEKDPQQRTPGKIKTNNESNHKTIESSKCSEQNITDEKTDGKVALRVRRHPSIENRNDSPLNNHNPKTTINRRSMPSISDLKLRSSVSISHKAEI